MDNSSGFKRVRSLDEEQTMSLITLQGLEKTQTDSMMNRQYH